MKTRRSQRAHGKGASDKVSLQPQTLEKRSRLCILVQTGDELVAVTVALARAQNQRAKEKDPGST